MRHVATGIVMSLMPVLLFAQDTLKTSPALPDFDYGPGIAGIAFKLVLSLVLIIGMIYLSVFFLKKLNNRNLINTSGYVEVVGKTYLTPKQSLFIVKLGSSYAILGVGENSVNLIKELSAEEVEPLRQNSEKPKSFQNVLKTVLRR